MRCNVLISGGTGSGKTTLLNCLTGYIDHDERVITCEDAAELQLQQPHVVRLETRPPNLEGEGEITMRDLVKNCLRMRPERIIVGEVRGPEAFDLLQAMNTGHDGSMGTLHANSPREAMSRLESMITMGGFALPSKTIKEMIVGSIDVIVQAARLRDGSRRITHITEVIGMEGDVIITQDLFVYDVMGEDANGNIIGQPSLDRHRPAAFLGPRPLLRRGNAASPKRLEKAELRNDQELTAVHECGERKDHVRPDQAGQLIHHRASLRLPSAAWRFILLYPYHRRRSRCRPAPRIAYRQDQAGPKLSLPPAVPQGGCQGHPPPAAAGKPEAARRGREEAPQEAHPADHAAPGRPGDQPEQFLPDFGRARRRSSAAPSISSACPGMSRIAAAIAGGLGLPRWCLGFLRRRRQQVFLTDFADAIDIVVRGLKSGLPVSDAMKVIAAETPPPGRPGIPRSGRGPARRHHHRPGHRAHV